MYVDITFHYFSACAESLKYIQNLFLCNLSKLGSTVCIIWKSVLLYRLNLAGVLYTRQMIS